MTGIYKIISYCVRNKRNLKQRFYYFLKHFSYVSQLMHDVYKVNAYVKV